MNYFLRDGLDLLQKLKSDGTVQEEYTMAKSPVKGIGQLVEVNRPGQTPQKIYPVMDPRGTITKYLHSDGATVQAQREYDSFGTIIPNSAVGTRPGIFGYQGQSWVCSRVAQAIASETPSCRQIVLRRTVGRDMLS